MGISNGVVDFSLNCRRDALLFQETPLVLNRGWLFLKLTIHLNKFIVL